MTSIWFGVRDRVMALQSRAKVFGSRGHGFELSECLSEAEVSEAETQFQVRFPDEYRSFLKEVGAGGAGSQDPSVATFGETTRQIVAGFSLSLLRATATRKARHGLVLRVSI